MGSAVHEAHRSLSCTHCTGFPSRTLERLTKFEHIAFLVAINLFEPMWYVREVVKNALSFTSHRTGLVLHLNAATDYAPEEARELWQLPRVEVSCWRLPVSSFNPALVLSHALNVDWALCRGARPKFVLFMASNMWWVRPGVELHVSLAKASVFCVIDEATCDTLRARHGFATCRLPAEARSTPEAPCKRQYTADARCSYNYSWWRSPLEPDDAACSRRLELLSLGAPNSTPPSGMPALLIMKHEGSFYPLQPMQQAIAALLTTSEPRKLQILHGRDRVAPEKTCVGMLGRRYPAPPVSEEWVFPSWMAFNSFCSSSASCPVAKYWDAPYLRATQNDCGESLDTTRCEGPSGCDCRYLEEFAAREPQFFAIKAHQLRDNNSVGTRLRGIVRAVQGCFRLVKAQSSAQAGRLSRT